MHGHHAERGPRHDGALAPAGRLAEFFSLWTFAVQLAAVIGPLTYGLVTWATHGNHRLAILVTGLFFVGGLALLSRVDMARGLARGSRAPPPERRHRRHIGRRGCYPYELCPTPPGLIRFACRCRQSFSHFPPRAFAAMTARARVPARILRKVPVRAWRYGCG